MSKIENGIDLHRPVSRAEWFGHQPFRRKRTSKLIRFRLILYIQEFFFYFERIVAGLWKKYVYILKVKQFQHH